MTDSPVPTIIHPDTGQTFRLGRSRPPLPAQRRMFVPLGRYMQRQLPKPPSSTNYAAKARAVLKQSLLNRTLGCCTAAGAFHILGSWFANAGHPVIFSDAQVQAFYMRSTGYVPGRPETDQGGNEVDVLDCWRDHGLIVDKATPAGRRKILGHLSVDATNPDQLRTAIYLFLNLYFGFELPNEWVGAMMPKADGAVWPVAGPPNTNNGHCFAGIDYNEDGVIVCTWGMLVLVPWDAIARYGVASAGGEIHVAISEDILDRATRKAPNGFAMDDLKADFAALGNPAS